MLFKAPDKITHYAIPAAGTTLERSLPPGSGDELQISANTQGNLTLTGGIDGALYTLSLADGRILRLKVTSEAAGLEQGDNYWPPRGVA